MAASELTIVYDGDCVLCRTSVRWLDARITHVPVATIAAANPKAVAQWGETPGYGDNMVAVADDGRRWVGPPDAYLVAMWAVRGTRWLSYLLALPVLRPLTGRVFRLIARNRNTISRLLEHASARAA